MVNIWIIHTKRLRKAGTFLLALVLGIGVLITELPLLRPSPTVPVAMTRIDTHLRHVAMTITIASIEDPLPALLAVLARQRIGQLTFFLDPSWATTHPKSIAVLQKAGHELGGYITLPVDNGTRSDVQLRYIIRSATKKLQTALGRPPAFIQFGEPFPDTRVLRLAKQLSLRVIASPMKLTKTGDSQTLESMVDTWANTIHSGDIVAFPPCSIVPLPSFPFPTLGTADTGFCPDGQSPHVLTQSIVALRAKGYSFTTVSHLLSNTHVTGGDTIRQSWLNSF
jgi:peptidoglycan/xylan/chitin deacetylase (PgdA/CDA1 family)